MPALQFDQEWILVQGFCKTTLTTQLYIVILSGWKLSQHFQPSCIQLLHFLGPYFPTEISWLSCSAAHPLGSGFPASVFSLSVLNHHHQQQPLLNWSLPFWQQLLVFSFVVLSVYSPSGFWIWTSLLPWFADGLSLGHQICLLASPGRRWQTLSSIYCCFPRKSLNPSPTSWLGKYLPLQVLDFFS